MTLQNYKRFLSVAKITAVFFYCTTEKSKGGASETAIQDLKLAEYD